MDKNISDEFSAFTEQVNIYLQTHQTLPYCKQCPKPQLCLVCLSSIGEALLIEPVKQTMEKIKSPPTGQ